MSDRYRLAEPRFVADIIDGEVLAVDLTTGAYHNLRHWSAYVWAHLVRGATVTETVAALDEVTAGADLDAVTSFQDQLAELGMLRPRDTDAEDGPVPEPPAQPWGALEIESFTDMADLILLDPVHEVDPDAGWPRRS